jgi:immune inhibitor A
MRVLFIPLWLLALEGGLSAMPLRPGQVDKGGVVDVKVRRITEVKPADTTAPPPSVALEGEHKLLVILVDTKDSPWPSAYDPSRYRELIFDKAASSMREFYREQSYGRFDLTGQVVGPVTVEGRMEDYSYDRAIADNSRVRVLIERAARLAKKQVSMSDYDTHDTRGRKGRDGIIDHVMFLYAEKTGKFDGFAPIWPHRGSLDVDLGEVRIASYVILNHAARLGVYVHEFGHDIGLPDLYDRDYSSYGVGDWCTMASGSWAGDAEHPVHFSAWAKVRLGWIAPTIIAKPQQNVRIPSSSERPFALKIPIGEIDSREYFLVENRRKVGFDQLLPTEGLLIWHVDEAKGDNDDENHKMVDVVEGARDQDLDRMNSFSRPNYMVDVFSTRGASSFDDSTEPSARAYGGEPSRIRIKVLTPAERVMAVDVDRPEVFNPGGVPFELAEDGYTFGRFSTVPLGKGLEGLMQLDATPGGYIAFGIEAFVSGKPGSVGKVTVKIYKDQAGRPGKVLTTVSATAKLQPEGYAWLRTRLSATQGKGLRLSANERVWIGLISEDGRTYPAMNPFSTTKRARYRAKPSDPLATTFNFKQGRTAVNDYILRISGFGYVQGSERPDPPANDADELVVRVKKADAKADRKQHAEAQGDYEALLDEMEKEPRRYETWIPVVVNSIGVMAYEQKKYDVALERFAASLRRAQAAKDDANTADIYENLGETSFYAGNMGDAKSYCDRSRALNAQMSRSARLVENLYWLGRATQEAGDRSGGEARIKEAQTWVKTAFAKDADEERDWNRRIGLALDGKPEDKPQIAERTTELKEAESKQKHRAKYTDLLQFLSEDATDDGK